MAGIYDRVVGAVLRGDVPRSASVLVVCGGKQDRDVWFAHGFRDVTISNMNDFMSSDTAPFRWQRIDAENIPHPDKSFDVVAVHGGLHHCFSPHRALHEMHRVARKAVVVCEARDSLTMRLAKGLGFTDDYEIEAVTGSKDHGGVAGGPIPNFVYRWTEREVRKAVSSFDPTRRPTVAFFYGLLLPDQRMSATRRKAMSLALALARPFAQLLVAMLPGQGNQFGWVIWKGAAPLHPWIAETGESVAENYIESHQRRYVA